MSEPRAGFSQLLNQCGCLFSNSLHVAAVSRMQNASRHLVTNFESVPYHFRALAEHLLGHGKLFAHDRRRSFFLCQFKPRLPAGDCELLGHFFRKTDGIVFAVFHTQHGDCRPQPEKAHAVTAFTGNLVSLPGQWQTVDFDHIVQHPGEYLHDLAEFIPVKAGFVSKRFKYKLRQVHRTQQARPVRRQRLFTARVGRPYRLGEPVVIHFIDAIDQDETRFGEIVRGRHDDIPNAARGHGAINLAGNETVCIAHVILRLRPFTPDELRIVADVQTVLVHFLAGHRKRESPLCVVFDGLHEFVRDQQRQIELA